MSSAVSRRTEEGGRSANLNSWRALNLHARYLAIFRAIVGPPPPLTRNQLYTTLCPARLMDWHRNSRVGPDDLAPRLPTP